MDDPAFTDSIASPLIVDAPTVAVDTGVTLASGAALTLPAEVVGGGSFTINSGAVLTVPGQIANAVALNSGVLDDSSLIYVRGATAIANGTDLTVVSNGATATFADTTDSGVLAVTFDASGDTEVIGTAKLGSLVAQAQTQTVTNSAQLFAAVRLVDQLSDGLASLGQTGAFTIDIANNITLAQQADAINLAPGRA